MGWLLILESQVSSQSGCRSSKPLTFFKLITDERVICGFIHQDSLAKGINMLTHLLKILCLLDFNHSYSDKNFC